MSETRHAQGGKTLEPKYFAADEIYKCETERTFGPSWLCVGRASEAAAPGDYFLANVEGESLIVLRGRDGAVRCFFNVCRHRGTRLCESSRGNAGKAIVCPYHGWAYDLQGRLIAAPNMRDVEGFELSQFPLQAAATAVWEGFVLVNLAAAEVPFEQAWAPLLGRFAAWRLPELEQVGRLEYLVQANWKLIFQNYSECYHCPRVHPALNVLTPFASAANDFQEGPFLGGPMQLAEGAESMSRDGRACGAVFPDLSQEDRRRVYYYSLFPTMFLSPHPDYVMTHRIERVDRKTTRVICDFLFHPASIARPGFDPEPAWAFWDQVNRQDWRVCELSQQGVLSRAYEPAPYSNLESMVAAFDRHYRERLETP